MPGEEKLFSLPFILRRMFPWGDSAKIQLEVDYTANEVGPFFLIGQTREGIFKFRIDPDGDGTSGNDVFQITDFPLWVTVSCTSISVNPRGFYGSIYLRVNGERVSKLVTGYTSPSKTLTWPAINEESQVPGRGWFTTEASSNPAAGSNISLTVPTGELWRIISAKFNFTTSATVANRRVHLETSFDASGDMSHSFPLQDQAAGLTYSYYFGHYGYTPDEFDNNLVLVNIPREIWVRQGDTIATNITNLQAGDDLTAMTLLVEKFLDQY